MDPKTKKIFYTAVPVSLAVSVFLFAETINLGKRELFLLLNTDLGPAGDQIFKYWTLLGDGVIWVPFVIAVFLFRKRYLPMVVFAILISTIITQGTKHLLFPGQPRPTFEVTNMQDIHTVPGVELNTIDSFPSGHTGTAFTIFLLACLFVRRWWIVPAGLLYAAGVGYSRIYLAQHFPVDVAAGILTGIITVICCLLISRQRPSIPI